LSQPSWQRLNSSSEARLASGGSWQARLATRKIDRGQGRPSVRRCMVRSTLCRGWPYVGGVDPTQCRPDKRSTRHKVDPDYTNMNSNKV
jgi:hypothetical protein